MCALIQGGIDHQQEALFCRGKLRNIVTRMGAADVLLHGAKAFFLSPLSMHATIDIRLRESNEFVMAIYDRCAVEIELCLRFCFAQLAGPGENS